MGLRKVVIVLCWWVCVVVLFSFTNFSLCFLSSNNNSPKHHWSSYSITLYDGPKVLVKEAIIFPISLTNSTVKNIHSQIPLLDDTIGQILFSKCMHAYLPTSISTYCNDYRGRTITQHRYMVLMYVHIWGPYDKSILQCVTSVPYSGPSSMFFHYSVWYINSDHY